MTFFLCAFFFFCLLGGVDSELDSDVGVDEVSALRRRGGVDSSELESSLDELESDGELGSSRVRVLLGVGGDEVELPEST